MGVFPKIVVPQIGWFISWKTENPIKIYDLGGFAPLFLVQHPWIVIWFGVFFLVI